MVRQYIQISDQKRNKLISFINEGNMSIAKAAKTVGIPYDNAKAINRTYQREQRISKIDYKERYLARKTKDVEEMLSKSKAEASDHAI